MIVCIFRQTRRASQSKEKYSGIFDWKQESWRRQGIAEVRHKPPRDDQTQIGENTSANPRIWRFLRKMDGKVERGRRWRRLAKFRENDGQEWIVLNGDLQRESVLRKHVWYSVYKKGNRTLEQTNSVHYSRGTRKNLTICSRQSTNCVCSAWQLVTSLTRISLWLVTKLSNNSDTDLL